MEVFKHLQHMQAELLQHGHYFWMDVPFPYKKSKTSYSEINIYRNNKKIFDLKVFLETGV
jgi:hypothetical protein